MASDALTWRVMTPNPDIDPHTFGFDWESPGQIKFGTGLGRRDLEKLRSLLDQALARAEAGDVTTLEADLATAGVREVEERW